MSTPVQLTDLRRLYGGVAALDGLTLHDRVEHDGGLLDGPGGVLVCADVSGWSDGRGLTAAEVAEEGLGHPEESNVGLVAVEFAHVAERRARHRHPRYERSDRAPASTPVGGKR